MYEMEAFSASEEKELRMRIGGYIRQIFARPIVGQTMKFALTTGLSACFSFGLPIILAEFFDFAQGRAVLVGFVCAYLFNVVAIRSFVFESQSHWARDLVIYVITNGALRVLEFGAFIIFVKWFGVHYAAALFVVLAGAAITKFFIYRYVFR